MKFRLETMVNTYNVRSKTKTSQQKGQCLDILFSQTTTNISTTGKRCV